MRFNHTELQINFVEDSIGAAEAINSFCIQYLINLSLTSKGHFSVTEYWVGVPQFNSRPNIQKTLNLQLYVMEKRSEILKHLGQPFHFKYNPYCIFLNTIPTDRYTHHK